MINEYLEKGKQIAREAGDFLAGFAAEVQVNEKGSSYDFVTNADLQSQNLIKTRLKEAFPEHVFIGEEDGLSDSEIAKRIYGDNSTWFWIVDPLDGTQNFIKHIGGYAVSMSLFHDGEVLAGITYVPVENELYYASKDGGAYLNGKRLQVSGCRELKDAFLNSGIPTVNFAFRERMDRLHAQLAMKSLNMRIIGSAARSLGLTAAGSFETYFELGPHPWDVGAGALMVTEAGGKVTDFEGNPYRFGADGIVAATPEIHDRLMEVILASR